MPGPTNYNADRVAELAQQIMLHKQLYYQGKPEISDATYDKLEDELRALSPDHPVLAFVGHDIDTTLAKATHGEPMLSLQKTYDYTALWDWVDGKPVVGTLKVDGNSLSVTYENGMLQIAKTRGNGRVGENVTNKIRWIADLPPRIPAKVHCEIRGELYCSTRQFTQLSQTMVSLGLEPPTNPRNIVAGLLGRKMHASLARHFNFFAFELLSDDPGLKFNTEMEKFAWLEQMGFRLPKPKLIENEDEIKAYLEFARTLIAEDEIQLDGAVFSYNELRLRAHLGNTAHHPRYKMSFKWQGETAVATIRDIIWATSRLGIVTPVAVIEPVYLSGATITNITLHNAAHVQLYNLKVGDQIEIVRSGEVIPKFLQVVKAAHGKYRWPKRCESCSAKLVFDEVRLQCPNTATCPAQQSGAILNWIRSVGIDDVSDKRLEQMLNLGLVKSPADLYRLDLGNLLTLPLTKERMAAKILANIDKSKSMPLAVFLTGLGIHGLGETTWEKLLEHHPSLDEVMRLSVDDIVYIDGFAEKTAQTLVDGLREKAGLVQELLQVGVQPINAPPAPVSGPLLGKSIAITGELSRPRKDIEALIKAAGGKPASSVSANTFALVTNETESGSSKMKKAKTLGIPIWTEEELLSKLK